MDADPGVWVPGGDPRRKELGRVPRVHEEERRRVFLDQLVAAPEGRRLARLHPEALGHLGIRVRGRWHLDSDPNSLRDPNANDLDGPADSREERPDLLRRPDRRGESDALKLALGQVPQALHADRQLGPALVRGEFVDLVHHDPPHGPEMLPQLASREEDLERLRGRDQDVGRVARDRGPFLGGRVTVADRDAHAESLREERHPPQHVPVERPQRRDVEAARRSRLLAEDVLEDRQKGRLRLPDARGRDEEDICPREDPRDRPDLRFREFFDPERPNGVQNGRIEPEGVHVASGLKGASG